MTTTNTPFEEPSSGDTLGLQLRLLYNQAYDEGFYKASQGEKFNTNTRNKTEHVAAAYKEITQLHKAAIVAELEELKVGAYSMGGPDFDKFVYVKEIDARIEQYKKEETKGMC